MIKKLILVAVISFLSFGFQLRNCQPQEEEIIRIGPDVRADLVYFFKKETTSTEISEFLRTVLGIPSSNTGYASLPGIMSQVIILKDGFQGEAIQFKPNATNEQKAFVKKRIAESPLVYKVYENVIPNEIKDLK